MDEERKQEPTPPGTMSRRKLLAYAAACITTFGLSRLPQGLAQASKGQAFPDLPFKLYLPLIKSNSSDNNLVGLCYSPYRDGQNPNWGPHPTESEIKADIDIVGTLVGHIRTYGSDNNLENIPRYNLERGSNIKVSAGCWLGGSEGTNLRLLNNLVAEASTYRNVCSVNVGNETMQFGTVPESTLVNYLSYVRQRLPAGTLVTTADSWFQWTQHPGIVENADYIMAHFHPYWETPSPIPISDAANFVKEKYYLLRSLYPSKRIVIGETGWPSDGPARGSAVPSPANQERFLREILSWAAVDRIDVYLFEAFDEAWKTQNEGEVGRHWGIYNANRTPKYPGLSLQ